MHMDTNFVFYNEYDQIFDHTGIEVDEQIIANHILHGGETVLELGARYGTVSCAINKKLKNPMNQVSVEPDPTVWTALEKNRNINNCKFYILNGVVSRTPIAFNKHDNPYASFTEKSTTESVNRITVEELESLLNIKFDTLIADCEGFLEQFFDENTHLYYQLKTVFFEKDQADRCNYDKIIENLQKHGFHCLLDGFHTVWTK
jgi:FkbM family methyltransferase